MLDLALKAKIEQTVSTWNQSPKFKPQGNALGVLADYLSGLCFPIWTSQESSQDSMHCGMEEAEQNLDVHAIPWIRWV